MDIVIFFFVKTRYNICSSQIKCYRYINMVEKRYDTEKNEIVSKSDVKLNSKFQNSIEYLFLREQINIMELFKINHPKDHIMQNKYA